MSSTINLKALGLNISPNFLDVPTGSLSEAKNVIIRRDNIIESRRGFKLYGDDFGSANDRAKQLLTYKQRILRHYSDVLQFDDGSGSFSDFNGSFSEVESGLRIKSIESNGNLYFTTSDGIKKLSARTASDFSTATGLIVNSGGTKALDVTARLNEFTSVGSPWFVPDSVVSYRVVWGYKDLNDNLILGTPSEEFTIYNYLINRLIEDFNRVLGALDDIANFSGGLVDDADYETTLKLDINSTASDLKTNLSTLVSKIDVDILLADQGGSAPMDMDTYEVASNVLTITFDGGAPDARDYFAVGDFINIKDFDTGIDGANTVTNVTATTLVCTVSHANVAAGTAVPGTTTIESAKYRSLDSSTPTLTPIIDSVTIDEPSTRAQLDSLKDYLQLIIDALNTEDNDIIITAAFTEYIQNLVLNSGSTTFVDITVPSEITTDYFYQIYRSPILTTELTDILSELVPNTELRLVYENNPTQAEIDSGTITVEDITPDDFMGAFLYTNPVSGEGILQANDLPPASHDINRFKDYTFYSNTRTRMRKILSLLGVQSMIDQYNSGETPQLTIANSSQFFTYDFIVGEKEITDIQFRDNNNDIVGDDYDGLYFTINSANDDTNYYVWYRSDGGTGTDPAPAGKQAIKVTIETNDTKAQIATKTANTINRYPIDFKATVLVADDGAVLAPLDINSAAIASGICTIGFAASTPSNYFSVGKEIYLESFTGAGGVDINGFQIITSIDDTTDEITFNTSAAGAVTFGSALIFAEPKASSAGEMISIQNVNVGYTTDAGLGTLDNSFLTNGLSITIPTDGKGEKCEQEVTEVACTADVAGSLAGTYFTINTAFEQEQYYIWYKVSGGGADPAPAGLTGIEVDIVTNDTAATVATTTKTVLDALGNKFITTDDGAGTLTITSYRHGPSDDASDVSTGFTITTTTQGALEVLLSEKVSVGQAVDETERSLLRVINCNKHEIVYGFNLSSFNAIPGQFLLEEKSLTDDNFYVEGDTSTIGVSFNPKISPEFSIEEVKVATGIKITNHGLSTGNQVLISGTDSKPIVDGIYTITVTDANHFTLAGVTITTDGTNNVGGAILLSKAVVSDNEVKPNRLYYSKFQQPEAVPIGNWLDIGAKDKAILRIFPLRNTLFVFKEDGLYRLSGAVSPFDVSLFDLSCNLLAPDSLSFSNNVIYGFTSQGVQPITESGVSIAISRPIDTEILKLASANYTNFTTATWGIGYDSDNSYTVWTIKNTDDTIAQIGYRYSNLTQTWTTFEKSNTCGTVHPSLDRLYLGAGDTNFIEEERKKFHRTDYADREFNTSILAGGLNGNKIILLSVSDFSVGDAVVQEQTLSIYEFNLLLKKLDTDSLLSDSDYFSSLEASSGDDLSNLLDSLITKVSLDAGRLAQAGATAAAVYTALEPTPSDFAGMKTTYNDFIGLLNADTGVAFANYNEIDTTTNIETVITAINTASKTLTVDKSLQYIVGDITIYKAIENSVIYTPVTMGDPLMLKHLREATVMFVNKAFTSAMVRFATDLLPGFTSVNFNGQGNGIFGNQENFGDGFFGGNANSIPFRTYIPRDSQRCRHLTLKFIHKIARENVLLQGISVTGEVQQSTRAYR